MELKDGLYEVNFKDGKGYKQHLLTEGHKNNNDFNHDQSVETETKIYDTVVMATPLTKDKTSINFKGFPKKFSFPGRFVIYIKTHQV